VIAAVVAVAVVDMVQVSTTVNLKVSATAASVAHIPGMDRATATDCRYSHRAYFHSPVSRAAAAAVNTLDSSASHAAAAAVEVDTLDTAQVTEIANLKPACSRCSASHAAVASTDSPNASAIHSAATRPLVHAAAVEAGTA